MYNKLPQIEEVEIRFEAESLYIELLEITIVEIQREGEGYFQRDISSSLKQHRDKIRGSSLKRE